MRILLIAPAADLELLRVALRSHRDRWTMSFISDGRDAAHAITSVEAGPIDVLVANVHLTGPSGAALLDDVAAAHPGTIRIALTSRPNGEPPLSRMSVAHHVVTIPNDLTRIAPTVDRSLLLRDRLADAGLHALVTGAVGLPTPSASVLALRDALDAVPVDTRRVTNVIADDPALSAKVLHVVNSAYFALARPVGDPAEAVTYLGARGVGELVLGAEMLRAFRGRSRRVDMELERIRVASRRRADIAAALARSAGLSPERVRRTWSGALLADVGQLLLAVAAHADDASSRIAMSGPLVGAALLSWWGMPHHLVECVALSDEPASVHGSEEAALTWLARVLVERPDDAAQLDRRELAAIGLVPDDLRHVLAVAAA